MKRMLIPLKPSVVHSIGLLVLARKRLDGWAPEAASFSLLSVVIEWQNQNIPNISQGLDDEKTPTRYDCNRRNKEKQRRSAAR